MNPELLFAAGTAFGASIATIMAFAGRARLRKQLEAQIFLTERAHDDTDYYRNKQLIQFKQLLELENAVRDYLVHPVAPYRKDPEWASKRKTLRDAMLTIVTRNAPLES